MNSRPARFARRREHPEHGDADFDVRWVTRTPPARFRRRGHSIVPRGLPLLLNLDFHRLNENPGGFIDRFRAFTVGGEFTLSAGLQWRGSATTTSQRKDLQTGTTSGLAGILRRHRHHGRRGPSSTTPFRRSGRSGTCTGSRSERRSELHVAPCQAEQSQEHGPAEKRSIPPNTSRGITLFREWLISGIRSLAPTYVESPPRTQTRPPRPRSLTPAENEHAQDAEHRRARRSPAKPGTPSGACGPPRS